MYIPNKGRYNDYTSRFDVYLFTLRDYTEMINQKFGGTYIERSDMPIHSGYLLKFVDANNAKEFVKAQATSTSTSGKTTTGVLPHTDGNELPVYFTMVDGIDVIYIGLSEYAGALDQIVSQAEFVSISYNANTGTGTMNPQNTTVGKTLKVLANGFTAPDTKEFDGWNTAADGSGTGYTAGQVVLMEENIVLYAQWK